MPPRSSRRRGRGRLAEAPTAYVATGSAERLGEVVGFLVEGADSPVRTAFLTRALRALAGITPRLADRTLADATAAATDGAVLIRALGDPEALATLTASDPLASARVRGLEARARILQGEGGVLSAEQVARHLGLTRQAVDKRRRAGRLLALDVGRRGYAYPAWQFGQIGVLGGLPEVLADLGVRDPWMQAAFFVSGDPRLGGAAPLEELRRGNVEMVRRAARGYGEHSAA